VRGTGIESVMACQTARALSPNLLSPNLCRDVDIGRLDGASRSRPSGANAGGALDDAYAERGRLIREGFEQGIPGEQLADAASLSSSSST
jgi:hypothetical protein